MPANTTLIIFAASNGSSRLSIDEGCDMSRSRSGSSDRISGGGGSSNDAAATGATPKATIPIKDRQLIQASCLMTIIC